MCISKKPPHDEFLLYIHICYAMHIQRVDSELDCSSVVGISRDRVSD